MYIDIPENKVELAPKGNHALFLEKLVIFGNFESNVDGWKPSLNSFFEFQYVREKREDQNGDLYPVRIGRSWYGSKKLRGFLEDLILDFPEARTPEGILAEAVVGRVYNTLVTHSPAKRDRSKTFANVSRILQSVDPSIFSVKGVTMTGAPVFFSIFQNPATGAPYASAAEVVACPSFLSLADWQKEKTAQSLEFCALPDAARYDIRRDDITKRVCLDPKDFSPDAPAKVDEIPDGDDDDLPF